MRNTPSTDYIDPIIREPECKRVTGLSRTTRWRLIRKGAFPKPVQLSENARGWRLSWIRDWLASREIAQLPAPKPRKSKTLTADGWAETGGTV